MIYLSERSTCGEVYFRCGSGQCVLYEERCDGVRSCHDGTDEEACGMYVVFNITLLIYAEKNMVLQHHAFKDSIFTIAIISFINCLAMIYTYNYSNSLSRNLFHIKIIV